VGSICLIWIVIAAYQRLYHCQRQQLILTDIADSKESDFMKNLCLVGILCVFMVFLNGCIIVSGNDFEPDKCGVPKEARKVGGGLEISYIAPEDGVINLVDLKSGKNLMSKSVVRGEKYEFSAKALDPENEKKWGVDIKKADFVLYFLPTQPKPPVQPQPPLPPLPPQPAQP
jgi:hypothetical protein